MTTGQFFLGLVIAVGIVMVAAEVSTEAVNAILVLILVGIILSRWGQLAPYVRLAGRAASGEGPNK